MINLKFIDTEDVPCWYEISWRPEERAILLRIHEDFLLRAWSAPKKEITDLYRKEFELGEFLEGQNGRIGFDGALIQKGKNGDFLEHLVPLPEVKKRTTRICEDCEGTGQDVKFDPDRECLRCDGEKVEIVYDHSGTHAVSATLTLILDCMRYTEIETSAKMPQLFTVSLGMRIGAYFIGGMYSVPLVEMLSRMANQEILPMIEAMRLAYEKMIGIRPFNLREFGAWVRGDGGRLNIDCPGNACGLYPSHTSFHRGHGGYEFADHNVDTAHQQLTLLAGLAALHDLARKELT